MNLTGGQQQYLMDTFLHAAMKPIILNTDLFDKQLVYLLGKTICNKKRKISSIDREIFIQKGYKFLLSKDREEKNKLFEEMYIERRYVSVFLENILAFSYKYVDIYEDYVLGRDHDREKMLHIESVLGIGRNKLYLLLKNVRHNLDLYNEVRRRIESQYVKFVYKVINQMCKSGRDYDHHDLEQNLRMAVLKALDKYNASEGALTSYVKHWILNAKTHVNQDMGHEYGIAFNLPTNEHKKRHSNFTTSLSTLSVVKSVDNEKNVDDISVGILNSYNIVDNARLIKKVDPKGYARLYLDLHEYFFLDELDAMNEDMAKNELQCM